MQESKNMDTLVLTPKFCFVLRVILAIWLLHDNAPVALRLTHVILFLI